MVGSSEWRARAILYQMDIVPLAIAHRGDPISAPENTLAAFTSAVQKGADMVEVDVRCTRDGAIVILHDPTLSRIWGLERNVADLDLPVVQALSAGSEHIPTLRQVLDQVHVPLMVDFTGKDVIEGALVVTREASAMERCLFVSGNVEALRLLRQRAPEARIGLTWVKEDPPAAALLHELGAEYWNPKFALITPRRVDDMHRLGVKVSTWTVDKPRQMARVIAAGVDAVVSNRIETLRRKLS
jgi:glycerophosphoryl diester phosphodiesterase